MAKSLYKALVYGIQFFIATSVFAYGPDCYDLGGSDETCSGGDSGFLGWLAIGLVAIVVIYAYIHDHLTRKALNIYAILLVLFLVGAKLLGTDIAAAYFVAAAFIYHFASEKKPPKNTNFLDLHTSSNPIESSDKAPTANTVDDSFFDPNKIFTWPPGTWIVDWFEMRYPSRTDPDRDRLADLSQELCEELYGLDSSDHRNGVKICWLVGYEEGRYAALGITKRSRSSSFFKAQKEFNFYTDEYKDIFFEGYDEAVKKFAQ